jgi:PAS domain-containing protein
MEPQGDPWDPAGDTALQDLIALTIGVSAGLAACVGLLVTRYLGGPSPVFAIGGEGPPAILMRNGVVIDASTDLAAVLPQVPFAGQDWSDLRSILAQKFTGLPLDLPAVDETIPGEDGALLVITVTHGGELVRVAVHPGKTPKPLAPALVPGNAQSPSRAMLDLAPDPVWQTGSNGIVQWYNAPYAQLCAEAGRDPLGEGPFDNAALPDAAASSARAQVALADGTHRWYALTTRSHGNGALHFATPIDALIEAEQAQRTFVQTLTKTFAHLPIGLAVFDRDHRLVLFNPALVDLTRLPVDFLASRPNLMSFFDHMRENRMMPEPKNYTTWREQLANVICAARDDRYCETWNLPSGLTYKITGRPHPDRAVAFLMEDISAEISLTRRFRSELELTQSVIDCFDDAVAVFSQMGILTFCNAAYRKMWKCDPDSAFAEVTIAEATQDWQRACAPSPVWGEVRDFVLTLRERATWDTEIALSSGTRLSCTVEPVAAGATMIRFTRLQDRVPETA